MFKWLFTKKKPAYECPCITQKFLEEVEDPLPRGRRKRLTKEEIAAYNEKLRTDRDDEFRAVVDKLGEIIDDLYDDYAHRQISKGCAIADTFFIRPKDAAKYGWTEDDNIQFFCKEPIRVKNYVVEFWCGPNGRYILDSILKITKQN